MTPTQAPANGTPAEGQKDLQAQVDRLQAALKDAEDRIQRLEQQRDKYYEFAKLWIEQNCSLADWEDFNPADYTLSFDDLMAEVEAATKGKL